MLSSASASRMSSRSAELPMTSRVSLQRLQVFHADDHGSGVAVLGDHDAAVLAFQEVHDLREPVLHVCEGHLLTD